jgi:hypothetical protein
VAPPFLDARTVVVLASSQHTVVHCVIGLKILNELVNEMNQRTKKRSMTQHRKVATSFRDLCLLQVFEIAITLLNQVTRLVVPCVFAQHLMCPLDFVAIYGCNQYGRLAARAEVCDSRPVVGQLPQPRDQQSEL